VATLSGGEVSSVMDQWRIQDVPGGTMESAQSPQQGPVAEQLVRGRGLLKLKPLFIFMEKSGQKLGTCESAVSVLIKS